MVRDEQNRELAKLYASFRKNPTGREYEDYILRELTAAGYQAEPTKASNDDGADLVIRGIAPGITAAVQCKYYSRTLGKEPVQEVLASMAVYGANLGIAVSNQKFSEPARDLAQANGVILVESYDIGEDIGQFLAKAGFVTYGLLSGEESASSGSAVRILHQLIGEREEDVQVNPKDLRLSSEDMQMVRMIMRRTGATISEVLRSGLRVVFEECMK